MKMKNRIALDYAMLLVLLLLMVKLMTGVIVHEMLGIGFVVLTAVHLFNNKSWLKNMWKKKGRFALNVLLLLATLSTAVSGALLSVAVLRFLNIPYHAVFYTIHTGSAYALLALSLIHLAVHMKSILAFARNKRRKAE